MPTDIKKDDELIKREYPVPWYLCLLCALKDSYAGVVCEFTMAFLMGVLLYYGMRHDVATWVLIVALVLLLIFITWTMNAIYDAVILISHKISHGRYAKYCPYVDEGPPPELEEDNKE